MSGNEQLNYLSISLVSLRLHLVSSNTMRLHRVVYLCYFSLPVSTAQLPDRCLIGREDVEIRCVRVMKGHEDSVFAIQMVGDAVISGSADATLRYVSLFSSRRGLPLATVVLKREDLLLNSGLGLRLQRERRENERNEREGER